MALVRRREHSARLRRTVCAFYVRHLALSCAAPSPHHSCEPCCRRRLRFLRLCGHCLSHSAAPAPLESAATYVLTYVCARLSLARLLTTRAVPSPFGRPNVYVFDALRFSSTLLSSRAVTCTEYNLFSKLSSFRILFASKCHVKFYFTKTVALISVFEFLLNVARILLCQNGYN